MSTETAAPIPPILVELVGPKRETRYELSKYNHEKRDYVHVDTFTRAEAYAALFALADALGFRTVGA